MKKKSYVLLTSSLLSLGLAGCVVTNLTSCQKAADVVKSVTSVTLSASKTTISSGETVQISASIVGLNLEDSDKEVTFAIASGSDIAEITSAGVVSLKDGASDGDVIKVTGTSVFDPTKVGEVSLSVVVVKSVSGVVVTASSETIAKGETVQVSAVVSGENLEEADKGVVFSAVEGEDAAEVSEAGVVSLKDGANNGDIIKVRATSSFDSNQYGEVSISVAFVKAVTGISATIDKESLESVGDTAQISVSITGDVLEDADKDVTYVADKEADVSISESGLVTLLEGATNGDVVTINVTSKFDPSKSTTVSIRVAMKVVTDIEVSASAESVTYSEPVTISASVVGENLEEADKGVSFAVTEGSSLVEVSEAGVVSILEGVTAGGSATIKVTSTFDESVSKEVTLEVHISAATFLTLYVSSQYVDAKEGGEVNFFKSSPYIGGSDLSDADKELSYEIVSGADFVENAEIVDGIMKIKENCDTSESNTVVVRWFVKNNPSIYKDYTITLLGRISVSLTLPEGLNAKYYYLDGDADSSAVKGEEITDLTDVKARTNIYVEFEDDSTDEKILKFDPTSSFNSSSSRYYKYSGEVTYVYYASLGNVLLIDGEDNKSDISYDLTSCVADLTEIVGTFSGKKLSDSSDATLVFGADGTLTIGETTHTFSKSSSSSYDYIIDGSSSSFVKISGDVLLVRIYNSSTYKTEFYVISKDSTFSVSSVVPYNSSYSISQFVGIYSLNGVEEGFYVNSSDLYTGLTFVYENTSFADSSYAYMQGSELNSSGEIKLILSTNSSSQVAFKTASSDSLKGTYTCEGSDDLYLDGYSSYSSYASNIVYGICKMGEKTGKYVKTGYTSKVVNITFDDGTTFTAEVNTSSMTYVEKFYLNGEIFTEEASYTCNSLTLTFDGNGTVTVDDSATHTTDSYGESAEYNIDGMTATYTTSNNVLSFTLKNVSYKFSNYDDGTQDLKFTFEVSSKDPETLKPTTYPYFTSCYDDYDNVVSYEDTFTKVVSE